jgi:Asp-tRNA(Asn)/Glu-tRNA(Gln) amidotransferase A subunit family amidase
MIKPFRASFRLKVIILMSMVLLAGASQAAPASFKLEEATISDIHAAMKNGTLTARQLVEQYLARINAYDQNGPKLNAVILINPKALSDADALDAELKKTGKMRPLQGIPVLLKDNVDTEGLQTTAGSLSLKGHVPTQDAVIAKKLRDAGAVILAKMNLHEFAVWGETVSSLGGQTLNPYDLTRTPGGSSGGTGAGIAANFGTVGIGTDTVNSIRSPASANSLVGIRPTLGLVSRTGIVPYSFTQDTAGPITRTVADAARVLDVIAGYDPKDAVTATEVGHQPKTYTAFLDKHGLKGMRIGVLKSFFGSGPEHQQTNAVVESAIQAMKKRGAIMVTLDDPIDVNELVNKTSVHLYDLERDLNTYLKDLPASSEVHSLKEIIASGKYHPGIEANIKKAVTLDTNSVEYKDRLIRRQLLQQQVLKIMADNQLDAIMFPHQKRLVVPVGQTQVERNGALGSITGFPSIVVPAGFSEPTATAPLGVPVGMELLGRPFSEPVLIKMGYDFEQSTHLRKPPASTPPLM